MKKYILLLLSVSCFGQFNPTTWYEFGSGNYELNTFIGGVGGTINTRELLAAKLGINVGRIKKFEIIGSDIQCAIINGKYSIPSNCFENNTNITYYKDTGGLINTVGSFAFKNSTITEFDSNSTSVSNLARSFDNAVNLSSFNWSSFSGTLTNYNFWNISVIGVFTMNNISSMTGNNFENCLISEYNLNSLVSMASLGEGTNFKNNPNVILISMIKLKTIGTNPAVNYNNFNNIKTGCTIKVNLTLATANAGSAHADLVYAKNIRSAIVEFYDDAGNYVSTL